jgi:hypothetical protein
VHDGGGETNRMTGENGVFYSCSICSMPEIRTKSQTTQHGFLCDGDIGIEKVCGEEKVFCPWPTRAAKAEQKSLVSARQAQQTIKEGSLSFVLFGSPFT